MLHLESVAPATLTLAQRLLALPELSEMRLVGGTALALQLGHRTSVDLDLFGPWDTRLPLNAVLSSCGQVDDQGGSERIRFFAIDGVKVDCVNYPYPWLEPPVFGDGLRLASVSDIAAMKLAAATNRGTRPAARRLHPHGVLPVRARRRAALPHGHPLARHETVTSGIGALFPHETGIGRVPEGGSAA